MLSQIIGRLPQAETLYLQMNCHEQIVIWNWFIWWSYLVVLGRGPSVSRVSSLKAPEHQPQSSSPNLSPITSPSKLRWPLPIPEESTAEEGNSENEQAEAEEVKPGREPRDCAEHDEDNSFFEKSTVGKE